MANGLWQVQVGNADAGGDANLATVTFQLDLAGTTTEAQAAAQILAYFQYPAVLTTQSYVKQILLRRSGSAGNVSVPFPVTEYAALKALRSAYLVTMTAYSVAFGVGDLSPVGTSVNMRELTGIAGRSYQGRHFVPWVSQDMVSSDGRFDGTGQTALRASYFDYLLGDDPGGSGGVNLFPQVFSTKLSVYTPIIDATPQAVLSNLRTRRR